MTNNDTPVVALRATPADWLRSALLVGLALLIGVVHLTVVNVDGNPLATLNAMLAGTADKPFVYRQLAALVVRGLVAATGLNAYQAADVLMVVAFPVFALGLRA